MPGPILIEDKACHPAAAIVFLGSRDVKDQRVLLPAIAYSVVLQFMANISAAV